MHTQITGLGPVNADGSRKIFDKEPKPFIASAAWLAEQDGEPEVGDYLDIAPDNTLRLVKEETVSAQKAEALEMLDKAADTGKLPDDQKKTDGGEGSSTGSDPSPVDGLSQDVINHMFEQRLARLEIYLQEEGHQITKYDGQNEAAPKE